MRELALFAGAGGVLCGRYLGWRTVCAVELDPYAARVLAARQDSGELEPFPIWDDVRTFAGLVWRGRVDVVSGGFPCQDISSAGRKVGIEGKKSGLWGEMSRIIGEVEPRVVFIENSASLAVRGLGQVLNDLSVLGFDAEWGLVRATQVGAWHRRERLWIVAHRLDAGELQQGGGLTEKRQWLGDCARWSAEPQVDRVVHGLARRMDRIRCLGNGQVPQAGAAAFEALAKRGGWMK